MVKQMTALKFYFRNGETWTIDRSAIGDLWIKQITTSFGRIDGSDFQKIHPCESLKVEVYPEADQVNTGDINLGGLERGMFERVTTYPDIEKMDILFDTKEADKIYFPYQSLDADGMDNKYQSSYLAENGHLYIVIDPEKRVHDIYKDVK